MGQNIINIWQENHRQVKQFICIKMKGDDACHDILQNLFLKIVDKQDKLSLAGKPASYLIKMAQNSVIDHYRFKGRRPTEVCDCDLNETEAEPLSSGENSITLRPFIESLPPMYKEILILGDLQGLSQKELAEKLNISYSNARTRIQRARQMLKQAILTCCDYKFDRYGNIVGCCE